MAKIYISSTSRDLLPERRCVWRAIEESQHLPVGMETYGASEQRPIEKCLEDVRGCQGYVGIIGLRYGSTPKGEDRSFTQLEYEEAGKHGIPRLMFLLSEDARWRASWIDKDRSRIDAFRRQLQDDKLVDDFSDPDELYGRVSRALREHFPAERKVPPLLPYMCNRKDQEDLLVAALRDRKDELPVVFIVHGGEYQGHEMLRRRLMEYSLPHKLEDEAGESLIDSVELEWPERFRSREDLRERLRRNLADAVAGDGSLPLETIGETWACSPGWVMIHTHVLTEDWRRHDREVVDGFLDFWRRWPAALASHKMLVLLFVKYEEKRSLGWLTRRRLRAVNRRISKLLREQLAGPEALTCVVLPELDSIGRREAESWARGAGGVGFWQSADLLREIRRLYEDWERRESEARMPMETLASGLKNILLGFNKLREEAV